MGLDNLFQLLLLLGPGDLGLVLAWELEMRWRVTKGRGGGGASFRQWVLSLEMQDRRCFALPLNSSFDPVDGINSLGFEIHFIL